MKEPHAEPPTDLYAVLVADTDIDPHGQGDPELVGPFPTQEDAISWAHDEQRWIVTVLPIRYRANL